jgi:arginase family enzyme
MLNDLIIPAKELAVVKTFQGDENQLGYHLKKQTWNLKKLPDVAILGIPEGRGSKGEELSTSPELIRTHLYSLAAFPSTVKLVDLGDIKCGATVKDTYAAVKLVAEELSGLNIRLLILGGSQELTVPLLHGFEKEELGLVLVDDRIDNIENEGAAADEFFINNLPDRTAVTLLAGQSYFIGEQWQDLLAEGTNGALLTLGEIRADYKEIEPLIRMADLVSFDFGALKVAEAPGQYRISPNGLTGEEACQIAWYAGLATTPAWFALFGYYSPNDPATLGAMMAAQISWYFIHGATKKLDDEPVDEATNFEQFVLDIEGLDEPVTFLVHPISQRWWMEVPSEDCTLFPIRIPCSRKDYLKACNNEISEKWWSYFNKS